MSARHNAYSLILLSIVLIVRCNSKKSTSAVSTKDSTLFELVSASYSGIAFRNSLPESSHMNRFVYEYFYNGGGVAIGDVNNDGLDDIYFTSNLKDNKLYLNKGELRFKDITAVANVKGKKGWATGVTMVDINQDGFLDIYVGRAGRFKDEDRRRNELFINQGVSEGGQPVFTEQAKKYGLDDPSFTTQASFFDFDLDGDLDVFLANHNIEAAPVDVELIKELRNTASPLGGNKLLENNNGIFKDITSEAGIHAHMMNYTLGVSISDLNNDGWPDIYVANDYSELDHLYLNQGNGVFEDAIQYAVGHMPNFSMGSDAADINNDGRSDIMSLDMVAEDNYGIKTSMSGMNVDLFQAHVDAGLHHQYMYNALQLNNGCDSNGRPLFSEIGQLAGISNTDWSWAPLMADFNNDGLTDVYITNGIKRDFRNNDFNIFLRKATQKVIDEKKNPLKYYDQWTRFSPTREKANYAFRNVGDLRFSNVSMEWGLDQVSFSNGAAYSDLDNDGDLDLVVNNIDSVAFLYENLSNTFKSRHYLKVKLKGSNRNRSGIGTKVTLLHGDTILTREQYPTRGFQSSVTKTLHFGLGEISKVEKLKVVWPDGRWQELENVEANKQLELDYTDAIVLTRGFKANKEAFFTDVTARTTIDFQHRENTFDDFKREGLLPHKMSQLGPALAVGDINSDNLEDIYVGGAFQQAGRLYTQEQEGFFKEQKVPAFEKDKRHEDVASIFFDADRDGDMDLYVVSGGNELEIGNTYYQDRFYENRSGNLVKNVRAIPAYAFSGGCVISEDYDNDGDQDLFVGGRQMPGRYPNPVSSYIFRNDSRANEIRFTNVSDVVAPMLQDMGMVTDASWADIDSDGLKDLIIVGEWMPVKVLKNINGIYKDITEESGLSGEVGWWNCVSAADFDHDGDLDLVAGNLGLNYKYKASQTNPFEVYASDFDKSGTHDIVLAYHNVGAVYPVRGRQCSSEQMPFIKEKFASYDAFGNATISEVYGKENLELSVQYKATNFATSYIENLGNGRFRIRPLANLAQISSTNTIEVIDVNADSFEDLILLGNLYGSEVETPRNDASYGLCLLGDGAGNFDPLMPDESGLLIAGEVRGMKLVRIKDHMVVVAAKNKDNLQLVEINK
ncbi:VCBS repeat-containing protein [Fulvivirgaceae bacterium BMA12]|uniref:VCBS repeat-containing protein n=1 Tax=Agaribacillus aureus TaxID=3051825 RepID=A0ABT8KZ53_9BACT|nr:VCBS repeat-containing protein [Fulvivirgaceae bacterium BMA12]